jgi:hypothetical protein
VRSKLGVVLISVLWLMVCFGAGALAADLPETLVIDGFWYYDGYLADDIAAAGYIVIPKQPIALYSERDTSSQVVGVLPPDQEADLRAVSYIAHPGQYKLIIKQALATADGNKELKPGTVVGFVSICGGDALAVYYNGEIIAVETRGVEYSPEPFKYPQAQNQWLYLTSQQGISGWCQYSSEKNDLGGRWRINNAVAAGGSADLNPIVFGQYPKFHRLTTLILP